MANDQQNRCNAEQKEDGQRCELSVSQNKMDTEFAGDSWTRAAFDTEATGDKGNLEYEPNGKMTYNPETYTESYQGENSSQQNNHAQQSNSAQMQTFGQQGQDTPTANANAYTPFPVNGNDDQASQREAVQAATPSAQPTAANVNESTKYETANEFAPPSFTATNSSGAANSSAASASVQQSQKQETAVNKQDNTLYETAAEFAPPTFDRSTVTRAERQTENINQAAENQQAKSPASGLGWTALGVSLLALFFMPYLSGPVGIVLGYLAFRRNARTLGTWAMIVGALAIIGAFLVYPYYTAR
ncbi:hypothetical protein [Brevibacillus fulvus]|uniref:DUF4190 domain-containing protein n=1 Tax=Brevibacillus fulvus TaxID=1125967 RepID=A0A939BUV6_9BACL|nr:hypothetical protein [Brevibacillus fulvus]MBM7590824.1 hypothetical protein [Brevibacillus fulvus]